MVLHVPPRIAYVTTILRTLINIKKSAINRGHPEMMPWIEHNKNKLNMARMSLQNSMTPVQTQNGLKMSYSFETQTLQNSHDFYL